MRMRTRTANIFSSGPAGCFASHAHDSSTFPAETFSVVLIAGIMSAAKEDSSQEKILDKNNLVDDKSTSSDGCWPCHLCSYKNAASASSRCEICDGQRLTTTNSQHHANGTAKSLISDNENWACQKCTFINKAQEQKCGACDESKIVENVQAWTCSQCTFANRRDVVTCEICGHSSGNASSSQSKVRRPSTAVASKADPPMLLPVRQESEYMEALRAIEESEAVEQYQRILHFCRQNKQSFVDDSFPPTQLSLRRNSHQQDKLPPTQWLRPNRIRSYDGRYPRWTIFESPKPSDIIQGVLGNCWFLSALAVVAEVQELLSHIVITGQICIEGVYQIRLCIDGQWRIVVVDDLLPCTMAGVMVYSRAKRHQLWVPLIEKALAKVYGSYAALTAGRTVEGLAVLTGAPCEALHIPGHGHPETQDGDSDVIWAKLLSMKDAKFLMGASCAGDARNSEAEYHLVGLEPLHAYSLLDVKEVNGVRLLKLRNPWGHFEWNGAWSKHSSVWTPELLRALQPEGFHDGIFWMPFEDFCRYFDSVDVCRYRSSWRELRLAGLFPPHCLRNFVYVAELAVAETTEIDVALYQQNVRNEKPTKHGVLDLVLMIFAVDVHGRPSAMVARSVHTIRPFVICNTILQPGQYIMIWLAFNHWGMRLSDTEVPKAVVAVHSARKILAQVRSVNPIVLADCLIQMFLKEATCNSGDMPGVAIYYLTHKWTGVAIVVENSNPDYILHVHCDCTESQNAVSTRGALVTIDAIPPMHRQILIVLTQVEGSSSSTFSYRVQYSLSPTSSNNHRQQRNNFVDRWLSFIPTLITSNTAQPPQSPLPPAVMHSHMPELDAAVYGLHAPRPLS